MKGSRERRRDIEAALQVWCVLRLSWLYAWDSNRPVDSPPVVDDGPSKSRRLRPRNHRHLQAKGRRFPATFRLVRGPEHRRDSRLSAFRHRAVAQRPEPTAWFLTRPSVRFGR